MEAVSNNLSVNTNNSKSQKKNQNTDYIIAVATGMTLADVALHFIEKENRKDSFVNTARACAKAHTTEAKSFISSALKFITGKEDLANKAKSISNKKFFAGLLVAEIVANYGIIKAWKHFTSK